MHDLLSEPGAIRMPRWLRQIFLFLAPLLVGALNVMHPVAHTPIYNGVLHHIDWWIGLHLLNLVGFPLVGFAAYLLTEGIQTPAAIISRVAAAVFIPIYAAFDALAGVGTGTIVQLIDRLSPAQSATLEPILDAYWNSGTVMAPAMVGSIAWVIAMLSAAVALTAPERRRIVAVLSIVFFFVGAWARTNLMSADGGSISLAWWLVTAALAIAMLIVGNPGLPAALLGLAGSLFGAAHPMPTGPLGLACFLGAALYNERQRTPIKLRNAK
jgi:hypothetical protein